jgi:hypothetical protein
VCRETWRTEISAASQEMIAQAGENRGAQTFPVKKQKRIGGIPSVPGAVERQRASSDRSAHESFSGVDSSHLAKTNEK